MLEMMRKHFASAYKPNGWAVRRRRARMAKFVSNMNLPTGSRIIDLGGTPDIWGELGKEYAVTLVNLPGTVPESRWRAMGFECAAGDATDLRHAFSDQSFDCVFSNSVIEHVGDEARQEAFAAEVRRLAPCYWVQTPDPRFFVEAHTGIPGYWQLPPPVRIWIGNRYRRRLPAFMEFIDSTRPLSRRRMKSLFPNSQVWCERYFGWPKSTTVYKPYRWGVS